jgi:sortase (surface protein transpeptidase)
MTRGSGLHASPFRRLRRPAALAALLCGLLVAGVGACGLGWAMQTGRPATPLGKPGFVAVPRGDRAPVPGPAQAARVAPPVELIIPAIGVKTRLIRLGIVDGALQVPSTTAVAGWFTGSPRPGAIGSSVIAGHIDSVAGPGVFFRLRLLRAGNRVYVREADGKVAVFRVTERHMYLKTRFPTATVYGPVPNAQLRLITCGGTFDYATGHYLSNVVVYATLVRLALMGLALMGLVLTGRAMPR